MNSRPQHLGRRVIAFFGGVAVVSIVSGMEFWLIFAGALFTAVGISLWKYGTDSRKGLALQGIVVDHDEHTSSNKSAVTGSRKMYAPIIEHTHPLTGKRETIVGSSYQPEKMEIGTPVELRFSSEVGEVRYPSKGQRQGAVAALVFGLVFLLLAVDDRFWSGN